MPSRLRLLPVLLVAALLAVLGPTALAQPQSDPLSEPAQLLRGYLLDSAAPPAGITLDPVIAEVSNEQLASDEPERAQGIRANGRITGVTQSARRLIPRALLVDVNASLYRDAEGAWADIREPSVSSTLRAQLVRDDVPGIGDNAVLHTARVTSSGQNVLTGWLNFQRGRVGVELVFVAFGNDAPTTDLRAVAEFVDGRILSSPPGDLTDAERAALMEPTATALVRTAVHVFLDQFVEELDPAILYREAWEGAARALTAAGATDVPPSPRFPSSERAATALHLQEFPRLEQIAAGRLSSSELATAAIQELVSQRNDCHTYYLSPQNFQSFLAQGEGEAILAIGLSFATMPPLRIVAVLPGSPAAAAGFRRGQEILQINGRSTEGLGVEAARSLLNREEGALNTFVVRNPSGRIGTIMVAPARFRLPPLESEILPGNIGLLRFYTFQSNSEQVDLMRVVLEQFEASGVEAWIVDLRQNSGGSMNTTINIASLFVSRGVLFGLTSRDADPDFIEATGRSLPFQRPMAFLVGPGSASASEILPGTLQARGRAIVVGERTAGCVGSTRPRGLLDGSALFATENEIVIGPNGLHYHRIGLTPNIEAPFSPEDEEAGRDPQLAAAVQALQAIVRGEPVPVPATAP